MTALDLPSQASLAALPPRDKRRVATLIQQLLRVSEEHQRAAERWEAERREQRATIARHEATIAGLRAQHKATLVESSRTRHRFAQALLLVRHYQERLMEGAPESAAGAAYRESAAGASGRHRFRDRKLLKFDVQVQNTGTPPLAEEAYCALLRHARERNATWTGSARRGGPFATV